MIDYARTGSEKNSYGGSHNNGGNGRNGRVGKSGETGGTGGGGNGAGNGGNGRIATLGQLPPDYLERADEISRVIYSTILKRCEREYQTTEEDFVALMMCRLVEVIGPRYRSDGSKFTTFFWNCARNAANSIRKYGAYGFRRRQETPFSQLSFLSKGNGDGERNRIREIEDVFSLDPAVDVERNELIDAVKGAFEELSAKNPTGAEVLRHYYHDGMILREIGAIFGKSHTYAFEKRNKALEEITALLLERRKHVVSSSP